MNCQTIEEKEQPIIYYTSSFHLPPLPNKNQQRKCPFCNPSNATQWIARDVFLELSKQHNASTARAPAAQRASWLAPFTPTHVEVKSTGSAERRAPRAEVKSCKSGERTLTIKSGVNKLKNNFMKGECWLGMLTGHDIYLQVWLHGYPIMVHLYSIYGVPTCSRIFMLDDQSQKGIKGVCLVQTCFQ